MGSTCIRCGKDRIFQKTWKEMVGTSVVTYTRSVCSDPECQKKVDEKLADLKRERAAHEQRRLQSMSRRNKQS